MTLESLKLSAGEIRDRRASLLPLRRRWEVAASFTEPRVTAAHVRLLELRALHAIDDRDAAEAFADTLKVRV